MYCRVEELNLRVAVADLRETGAEIRPFARNECMTEL